MQETPDDDAALKRRLLGRIVFAVVILAGLLASLAVFDRMNAPAPVPEKRAAPLAAVTAPSAARDLAPAPAADLIKSIERGKDGTPAEPEAPAVPEGSATPKPTAALAASGEKPLTQPATGRHALMRSPESATVPAVRADAARESGSRGLVPSTAPTPPTRSADSPAPLRPLAMTEEKPFALQLGVFNDVANAEELRARLEKAGIRASIEARVHVGPFATRAEADAARVKLRELGMPTALLLSMKGRKTP